MVAFPWLVPAMPLVAYIILLATGKRISETLTSTIATVAVAISFVLSVITVIQVAVLGPIAPEVFPWVTFGNHVITIGIEVTSLNALMMAVVSLVSTMVLWYSRSYMHGDPRFSRFFQYLSFFVFSMLGLVVSANLLEFYMFWELVGTTSYLLIGFYYFKPEAAAAAKKAFIVTRLGDVGLFIGMILLFLAVGSFNFNDIYAFVQTHIVGASSTSTILGMSAAGFATLTALLVFVGAVGKSAQFPLHTWLPDAMEGPTPVSALIHAATMVAAGVYLVARMYPLFESSSAASETVAIIGGITAILAAIFALTQRDIKRVIAYSTMSQLGYMMLGLGVGAYVSGMFHLMTHAFFKSLLFLAAGSVIHALDTQDIFEMGGLRKYMPLTNLTFLAGALALSGIPPFAGFWSKDDILSAAFSSGHYFVYALGAIAAFMTAFYIFRVYFMVFGGHYKGDKHPHEGGIPMKVPLSILAILATLAGFINTPFAPWLSDFLLDKGPLGTDFPANYWLMAISAVIGLLGIWLAYSMYGKVNKGEAVAKRMGFLYTLSFRKFYFDEIYHYVITVPVFFIAGIFLFIDRWIVDGIVKLVGEIGYTFGIGFKYSNNGQIQTYGLISALGLVILVLIAIGIGGVL